VKLRRLPLEDLDKTFLNELTLHSFSLG